jgi:hypothetical protein
LEYPFEGAIKKGKAKGVIAFSGHLYKQSQAGKTAATIFALINLAPDVWKQRQPEGVDQDTPPPQRVEIVMVDGRKDDQTED